MNAKTVDIEDATVHPLLRIFRPNVATPAIEALADAILITLDQGYRGLSVYGFARFGKTEAARYLMDHTDWLRSRIAAIRSVEATDQKKRTDRTFYHSILHQLRVRFPARANPEELCDFIATSLAENCQNAQTRLAILFIDEAQRLLPSDYENLVSIDNRMTRLRYYLCVVFINQRDMTGFSNELVSSDDHPPHVMGRFLVSKHLLAGVRDASEVAQILGRYDEDTEWPPGSSISYTRHFALSAFTGGFRLATYAQELWNTACNVRAEVRLAEEWTWPMKSFEGTVVHLLTNVIPRTYDFEGFTSDNLVEAIRVSGLIELEQSRHTYKPQTPKP